MKKTILAVLMMLFSGGLAGCIEGPEAGVQYISSADCGGSWHVEFVDMSNDNFAAWEGEVQFIGSDGSTETISDFSSQQKYVLLDESLTWSLKYTFYEDDIGFINNGVFYGGNNDYGESGTVDLVLTRQTSQSSSESSDENGAVSYSDCKPDTYHVEFYDMSAFDFCCWDGEVEFTNPAGDRAYLSSFSSSQKYVILEQGHVWTMDYAFYEYDIGFIVNGENYGGNNDDGESGSITIDLS